MIEPSGNGMRCRFSLIEKVIHQKCKTTKESGVLDTKTNEVVCGRIGMGKGANRHAETTIGADGVPIVKAGDGINFPLKSTINVGAILH